MPTVTLNRKVFEKLVGKKLPTEKLKDRISMLGTDLEEVNKEEIIVEVFPNRPDMLSEQGFARAFSSFIGSKKGLKKYNVKKSSYKVKVDASMKNVRPNTACAIIKNMKFDNEKIREVIQIQEKLHVTYGRNRKKAAIGIYPMEKIKMPITFTAMKGEKIRFRPLESEKEMTGNEILNKHPTGRDYAHLLEGMQKYPIFIDANNEILSMPPIINSHNTGRINERTKDVFIECSGFDQDVLNKCLNILVTAMADMGGEIYSMEVVYGSKKITTPDLKPREMKLDLDYANKVLGLELKQKDIKDYLEKMGFGFANGKVLVPAYRTDILHEMDLVEDIAIAYGYENFEPEIPNVTTTGEEESFEAFCHKVARFMVGLKLIETSTYHLINKADVGRNMNMAANAIELENPLNAEYNVLRNWMIPSLMCVLGNNKHYEYPQNLFEIGTVFEHDNNAESNVSEFKRMGVVLCDKEADYTQIRQVLDALMNALGLGFEVKSAVHKSFIDGRVGRVSCEGKNIAYIGEINPIVLENYELKMPIAALEINMTELFGILKKKGDIK